MQFLYTMTVSSVRITDGLQVASFSLSNEVGTVTQPSVQVFSVVLNPDVAVTAALLIAAGNTVSGYTPLVHPITSASDFLGAPWGLVTAPGSPGYRWPALTTFDVDDTQEAGLRTAVRNVDAGDVVTLAVMVGNLGSFEGLNIVVNCEMPGSRRSAMAWIQTASTYQLRPAL